MKLKKLANCLVAVCTLVSTVMLCASVNAQSAPGQAEVRGVKGTAYATPAPGAPKQAIKVGDVLKPGATVETSAAATVDLFLGKKIGILRVTENTTLVIDKFILTDTGVDKVVDVQLNVPQGTILGDVHKLATASKYEIKVPNGVAGIRGTKYRISSMGYIVLLEGTLVFVYAAPGGNPVPYTLQAPPPVYFSPIEGVKPAPEELIKEVNGQWSGALGAPEAPGGTVSPPQAPGTLGDPALENQYPYETPSPTGP
jgi:hypothetical protein